jgi:hypothetical protein
LESGSEALDFLLVDALARAEEGSLTIDLATWFVALEPTVEGDRVSLRPFISTWCSCLVFLDRGEREAHITWTGPGGIQQAAASTTLTIRPTWAELWWPCLLLCLIFAGVFYSLWSLLKYVRSYRFPKRSGVSVYFGPRDEPLYRHLRQWDWAPFKAFIPFRGPPHAVRTVEGLVLRAARNGADILMDKSDPNFRIESLNQTIEECRAENAKIATYKLNWNDSVERRDSGLRRLTLLRRPEDSAA